MGSGKWKDKGYVPDSDDDEFDVDSQESEDPLKVELAPTNRNDNLQTTQEPEESVWNVPGLQKAVIPRNVDLPPTGRDENLQTTQGADDSVWDVPRSSLSTRPREPATQTASSSDKDGMRPSTEELASSPLSSAQDVDELADILDLDSETDQAPPHMTQAYRNHGRNDSPDPLGGDDSISTSYVEITAPVPEFPVENEIRSLQPPATSVGSRPLNRQASEVPAGQRSPSPLAESATQVARRYERSFRPRKPIQEHPYLIENAQYSKFFKSHGLRPIRMPASSPKRNKDEDSQEQDFEASQGSTAHGPNETTDESQSNGLEEPAESMPLRMSLSPSPSPLRTSSPKHKGGPSSQPSQDGETDNTSISEVGELPSLEQIFRNSTTAQAKKWRRLAGPGTARRRTAKEVVQHPSRPTFQTYDDVYGSVPSSSPAQHHVGLRDDSPPLPDIECRNEASSQAGESFNDDDDPFRSPQRMPSVVAETEPVDMTVENMLDAEENTDAALCDLAAVSDPESNGDQGSGSESGSEAIKNVRRRIRGVLPASWLRLDQQSNRPKPTQQQHPAQSPEKTQRRGVAVRRIGRTATATALDFLFDDSDEEVTPASRFIHNAPDSQTAAPLHQSTIQTIQIDDDDSSAMEDNEIDHMAPSRKRQLSLTESFGPANKRRKRDERTAGVQAKKSRQTSRGTSRIGHNPRLDSWVQTRKTNADVSHLARLDTPPRLSILDVIEPEAPRFLKIAARAAQSRRHLGRTSPTNKTIRLATRKDNVDAGEVLQKWKGGKIRPRQGVRRKSRRGEPGTRRPLTPLPTNVFSRMPAASPKQRTVGQPTRPLRGDSESAPSPSARSVSRPLSRQHSTASQRANAAADRPAQLEVESGAQVERANFHAKKRALDALFQRNRRQSLSAKSTHLEAFLNEVGSVISEHSLAGRVSSPEPPVADTTRSKRLRKPIKPVQVDTTAARFRHVDDPIPTVELPSPVETPRILKGDGQLLGLGPFGTHYTQHFETFPLDRGVFFHGTTLLGSGRVESAVDEQFSARVWLTHPRISFHLGEQILRWDSWTEQVSSELGILLDGVWDQIIRPTTFSEPGFSTKEAALFVLDYVQKSMSFADDAAAFAFVERLLDVNRTFLARLASEAELDSRKRLQLVEVLSSLLLVTSAAFRLCQKHDPLASELFTVENMLRKTTDALAGVLVDIGLDEITILYDDLQTLRYRERGIRTDKPLSHAWVLLMKVSESLRIPRLSFWDIAYPRLFRPEILRGMDAQEFERLWKSMFTLLPLCEFDNMGLVIADRRHQNPMEGWTLPQQILKRVFQLYRDNPRQSPSFNDYCRALVSRCHYLVDQWGWQKCGAVIGTIFDFFGSQNLSHLRNEEAFRSARFLDNLHQSPSLKIQPEDRCFHIFLKLVGLAIKKLRQKGMVNDIRNLVARTLPNHDRQYSKEQNVHQHDLAALRNHHDLLCTLFWASPPDLRPGIHNLEKLVIPASSHKEACLINLRAWNQLARFVAQEESSTSFVPLANWQTNVFKQLLDQYNSAASDIQQQFLAMSKDATSNISEAFMSSIVESNKAATMEIMLFSVKSSMDVVKYAGSLELARLASSTVQLQQVFQHFSTLPTDFPSALLQAALTTTERLIGRIERVFNEASGSQNSTSPQTLESEDAILMLERDLAAVFFSMSRCILSYQGASDGPCAKSISHACVEQSIIVSGMMTSLFVRCEMMRISHVFKHRKYRLFETVPNKLSMHQRTYLPLFLSTISQRGAEVNLTDIGIDILDLWLLIIVQPNHCLRYENQLGQCLQSQGWEFVPAKATGFVANPGYLSNRSLFEHVMGKMRQHLQCADAATKKNYAARFSKALDSVMLQMRADLQVVASQSPEHPTYVGFVRSIISLITTYGADIRAVHPFFKDVSKVYSPPAEDPQLQAATIQSYGLRLQEGDQRTASTLIHLFLNNFKQALRYGKLPEQVLLLRKAMDIDAIERFTVRMLSAVLHATLTCHEAYALLDVYCDALALAWAGSAITRPRSSDTVLAVVGLVTSILAWAAAVKGITLCPEHAHVFRKVVWLLNTLQPAIDTSSLVSGSLTWWDDLLERLHWFSLLVEGAREHVGERLSQTQPAAPLTPSVLFRRLRKTNVDFRIQDATVLQWSDHIVNDIQQNWVLSGPIFTSGAAGSSRDPSSTQPALGTVKPSWDMMELVTSLHDQLGIWELWWNKGKKDAGERDEFGFEDYMIF